jgi:hypothetical protein
MVSHQQVRDLALGLPEAVEQDHHGRPSFRVAGKIFATLWDAGHLNAMPDVDGIRTAVQAHPDACAERWWGKRLAAVQVDLERASADLVADLLADAWEHKAPKRLSARPGWNRGAEAGSPPRPG